MALRNRKLKKIVVFVSWGLRMVKRKDRHCRHTEWENVREPSRIVDNV